MTAQTQGAHHIGLTVPDIGATSSFFVETLGYDKVGEKTHYPAIFVSDGSLMITLWQTEDPGKVVDFDRKNNVGLHHLALKVENHAALNALNEKLQNTDDVEIEFSPQILGGAVKHMMVSIPGGVRVEFLSRST